MGRRKIKVLYFFSSGFDTPNPSYHLMEAIIEDTLKSGIDVHMIASHMTGQNEDVPKEFEKYKNFTYDIVKRKDVKKTAFANRYLDGIKYAWDSRIPIKQAKNYDLIYVQSSPTALYNILVAKWYAKKKPVIYSIQDMFPGSSIHSGVMKNKFMQQVFYTLQKIAYKTADHINVISEDMKAKVMQQGVSESKISVVVDWCDNLKTQEVSFLDNVFVKKYKLDKEKFYVQYAGTMGFVFDYKTIIKVAKKLEKYEDIVFQMIGQGSQKEIFVNECKEKGLKNIVFYPLEPLKNVPHVYSACSVQLIPLKVGVIGNSVPSKAAQVMACERLVINSVDEDSQYFKMFNENKIGASVSNRDSDKLAETILDFYNDRNKLALYSSRGKEYGAKYYSRVENTTKLVNQLKDFITNKNDSRNKNVQR